MTQKCKADIINAVAINAGTSESEAARMVDMVFDTVITLLTNGDGIRLHGLGTFTVKNRPARTGRNPKTGETVHIGPRRQIRFTPAGSLKDAANQ